MSEETKNKILNKVNQAKEQNKGGSKKVTKENFLILQLPKNQNNGKKRIRILPAKDNEDSPLSTVYFHHIKVGDYYMKLYDYERNDGEFNPLNELKKELYNNGDEESRKLASNYNSRLFYIFKVIDRDYEDDGPKFWRFGFNKKADGIMDKLEPIIEENKDITDPENGRDLILDLVKDGEGRTNVSNVRPADPSSLCEDSEKKEKWLNDEKTWKDIYRIHPVSYLEVVAKGDTPIFDKKKEKFVSKEEQQGETPESAKEQANVDSKESTEATDTSSVLKTKKEKQEENTDSTESDVSNTTEQSNNDTEEKNSESNNEPVDEDLPF